MRVKLTFFYPLSQDEWDKIEALSHIQLLEVIGKLNELMIRSLKNWEEG